VQSDLAFERQDNSDTKKKLSADSRQLKELQRENDRLKTDLQLLEVKSVTPVGDRYSLASVDAICC
jgi:phage host-nuclease inhibitor protein Gam